MLLDDDVINQEERVIGVYANQPTASAETRPHGLQQTYPRYRGQMLQKVARQHDVRYDIRQCVAQY